MIIAGTSCRQFFGGRRTFAGEFLRVALTKDELVEIERVGSYYATLLVSQFARFLGIVQIACTIKHSLTAILTRSLHIEEIC